MVFDAQTVAFEASPVLSVQTWPGCDRYWFEHADYDEPADRLFLNYGPPTAASAYMTPEGHVVRTAAPAGYVCGLVVNDLRRRLSRHGSITLTLRDLERLTLTVEDVAAALTGGAAQAA
jgi:hypothetical protein